MKELPRKRNQAMCKLYYLPLCITVIALSGCNDKGLSADEKEERNPLVKTAVAYMDQSRWDEAEQALKEALDNDPDLAKPHLELALIYQQYKPNYIHAVYHFDRYLELRPQSEKAALIREQRDKVLRALEIQAIQNSPELKQIAAQLQQLRSENEALRKQLAPAAAPAPAAKSAPGAESKPAAVTAAATAATGHQIYTVVQGDTLTKIASKFYGDGGSWEPIFEANRDSLSSPSSLRVGQTLVIPAKDR
jgi:tetratricopeptide (TPR) repeat protein